MAAAKGGTSERPKEKICDVQSECVLAIARLRHNCIDFLLASVYFCCYIFGIVGFQKCLMEAGGSMEALHCILIKFQVLSTFPI